MSTDRYLDGPAVHQALTIRLDRECKSIIPGRSPWPDCRSARRWLSQVYDQELRELATYHGVGLTRIRKAGPGLQPFLGSVSEKFKEQARRSR